MLLDINEKYKISVSTLDRKIGKQADKSKQVDFII